MTSVDTIAYQVLTRSGTTLNTLVGARVEFGVAPATFSNSAATLVFRPEDGDSMLFGVPVFRRSYLFECWGGDGADADWSGAEAVYKALHDAWHDVGQLTVAGGVMMQGWEEQAGVPLVHPDTRQKYYVCRMAGKFRGA